MTDSHHIPRVALSLKKTKTLVNDEEDTVNILFNTQVFGVLASALRNAVGSEGTFLSTSKYPKKPSVEILYESRLCPEALRDLTAATSLDDSRLIER